MANKQEQDRLFQLRAMYGDVLAQKILLAEKQEAEELRERGLAVEESKALSKEAIRERALIIVDKLEREYEIQRDLTKLMEKRSTEYFERLESQFTKQSQELFNIIEGKKITQDKQLKALKKAYKELNKLLSKAIQKAEIAQKKAEKAEEDHIQKILEYNDRIHALNELQRKLVEEHNKATRIFNRWAMNQNRKAGYPV